MLNMDFSRFVAIDTTAMEWVPSPAAGVWRKPLAREEAERGHATSIVRYDPGSSFKSHNHPLGEEILVLDGTFSDETGDFHSGTYFRNPKGFIHAPFSKEGCVILVKLHQFQEDDKTRLAIKSQDAVWEENESGLPELHLHNFGSEHVKLLKAPAGTKTPLQAYDLGAEIYIISGAYQDTFGSFSAGTWIRMPPGSQHAAEFTEDSLLWIKTGHLQSDA